MIVLPHSTDRLADLSTVASVAAAVRANSADPVRRVPLTIHPEVAAMAEEDVSALSANVAMSAVMIVLGLDMLVSCV
jgi:hypothetical protein